MRKLVLMMLNKLFPFRINNYIFFLTIILSMNSCNLKDFTNQPREDRIEVIIKAKKGYVSSNCDFDNQLEQKVNFEVMYPEKFDHKELAYDDKYTHQFIDGSTLLLNLGRIRDVYSYILLDTFTNNGTFHFFTDLNRYDGISHFKFGEMSNVIPCKMTYLFDEGKVKFWVNLTIKRPLFRKDDLDMSSLLGYADFIISGCSTSEYNDSIIDDVFFNEMDYIEKHKEAIDDKEEYRNAILRRFNMDTVNATSAE